jgi:hypothetical protein
VGCHHAPRDVRRRGDPLGPPALALRGCAVSVVASIGDALAMAGSMTWQTAWSLVVGFTLSAVVQAVVRRPSLGRVPFSFAA